MYKNTAHSIQMPQNKLKITVLEAYSVALVYKAHSLCSIAWAFCSDI